MKRFLSILLVLTVITITFPFGLLTANAAELTSYGYKYTISSSGATITGVVNPPKGNITIPSTLGSYPVKRIGYEAFKDCEEITSITLPNSLEIIEQSAFEGCSSLTTINIPSTVTQLGYNAFLYCQSLTDVHIDDFRTWCETDFPSEHANPMAYAENLYVNGVKIDLSGDFTFPDGIYKIGEGVFWGNEKLTSVTIPSTVTTIGHRAFDDCTGLTAVYITDLKKWCEIDFKNLDANPLTYAKNLYVNGVKVSGNLVLPEGTKKINRFAFTGCEGLSSVSIPNSVKSIEFFAFGNCPDLTSITIPDSVTYIGESAFLDCINLTSVTLSNNITCISDRTFYECKKLESITIPNGVTSIGEYAFVECTGLKSVTLPDTLNIIDECSFWGCTSLTSVTIPDGVTTIGNYAFRYCSNLASINIPDGVTFIGEKTFEGCDKLNSATDEETTTTHGNTDITKPAYTGRSKPMYTVAACGLVVVAAICAVIVFVVKKRKTRMQQH